MAKKFAHEASYRGDNILARLARETIVVCGAGALGSNLIDMLARQGASSLRAIDMDRVDEHNVNTQLYGDADVGAMKVNALQSRIFRDTGVEVETFNKEMDSGNIKKFLKGADLVVDVFDNRASRQLVHEFCVKSKVPCLHAGMFEDYGEVAWDKEYYVPADAPEGVQDVCDYPLARNLVMMVTTIAAEEIVNFCTADNPRLTSWSITLKDLAVRAYR